MSSHVCHIPARHRALHPALLIRSIWILTRAGVKPQSSSWSTRGSSVKSHFLNLRSQGFTFPLCQTSKIGVLVQQSSYYFLFPEAKRRPLTWKVITASPGPAVSTPPPPSILTAAPAQLLCASYQTNQRQQV